MNINMCLQIYAFNNDDDVYFNILQTNDIEASKQWQANNIASQQWHANNDAMAK